MVGMLSKQLRESVPPETLAGSAVNTLGFVSYECVMSKCMSLTYLKVLCGMFCDGFLLNADVISGYWSYCSLPLALVILL